MTYDRATAALEHLSLDTPPSEIAAFLATHSYAAIDDLVGDGVMNRLTAEAEPFSSRRARRGDHVEASVDSGGNWVVLSSNTCFWQVRIEGDPGAETMVCRKGRPDSPTRQAATTRT